MTKLDASGTPIGSSHMLASARDWASLRLLYLNDRIVGGVRVLPQGWSSCARQLALAPRRHGDVVAAVED
jgi:hypothetical protein